MLQPGELFQLLIEGFDLDQQLNGGGAAVALQGLLLGVADGLPQVLDEGLFELECAAVVLNAEQLLKGLHFLQALRGGVLTALRHAREVHGQTASLAIGAGADHLAIEPVSVLLPCGLELLAQALSKRAYHHGIEGGVGELAAGELSAPVAGLLFLVDLAAQVVLGHSSQVVPGQIPNQLAGQHGVPPAAKRADLDLRRANTSAPLSR